MQVSIWRERICMVTFSMYLVQIMHTCTYDSKTLDDSEQIFCVCEG